MSADPNLRLILAIIFLIAIGHCAIIPSKVCLKDFYRREPVAKGKCEAGKLLTAFLCYEQCPADMPMTEFDCIKPNCPQGFISGPTKCTQTYDRVFSWSIGFTLQSDQEAQASCENRFGRGGCVLWFGSWRPRCKEGYRDWVGSLYCAAYGFEASIGMKTALCLKERLYIVPSLPTCPEGSTLEGLSCYKPCKEGYQGVGAYCWRKSPKGMINCGAGSAVDSQSCTQAFAKAGNLTLSFNVAAEVLLESFRLNLVPQDNKDEFAKAVSDYFKELSETFSAISKWISSMNDSDPNGKSEILLFLESKQNNAQYIGSILSIAYIILATSTTPDLQVLQFMIEFLSLFTDAEIAKMTREMYLPSCTSME